MAHTTRKELPAFQIGAIDALHNLSQTPTQIETALDLPLSTIRGVLTRIKKHGSKENKQQPGRPRSTLEHDDRLLIRQALIHTRMPLEELKVEANSNLSLDTIRSRLREAGIQKWRAAERPRLKAKHVQKRIKWAKEHRHKTLEEWRKIIWSDECSVEKGADPHQVWVFRRPGTLERYKPQNVKVKDKGRAVSLMVWACFASNIQGPLVPFHSKSNAKTYIDALEQNLVPFIGNLPEDIQNEAIFQQDNASIHTAGITKEWFSNHNIKVMEWPPNSPDMNPIEHVWRALKAKLHSRFSDTHAIPGGPDRVRAVLEERLASVWLELEAELFEQLIVNMLARVEALFQTKRWYTRY